MSTGNLDIAFTVRPSLLLDGFPGRLDEVTIKNKGEIWRIHQNDADPYPSNPHAHNIETGAKLHLGTGELYHKHSVIGQISAKRLQGIRDFASGKDVKLPPMEI